jgi:hypothetical protein
MNTAHGGPRRSYVHQKIAQSYMSDCSIRTVPRLTRRTFGGASISSSHTIIWKSGDHLLDGTARRAILPLTRRSALQSFLFLRPATCWGGIRRAAQVFCSTLFHPAARPSNGCYGVSFPPPLRNNSLRSTRQPSTSAFDPCSLSSVGGAAGGRFRAAAGDRDRDREAEDVMSQAPVCRKRMP